MRFHMGPSMTDLAERTYKTWRKGSKINKRCIGEDPLTLKLDLGHFSEIKGNKIVRRREEEKRRERELPREGG